MNGRAIRKRLMRGRREVFWGHRAYLTVQIPLAAYPEQPPPFTAPGEQGPFEGNWVRMDGDVEVMTCVDRVSGGVDPRAAREDGDRAPLFVSQREGDTWWSWWEGSEVRSRGNEVLSRVDCDPAIVEDYRARRAWLDRWSWGHDDAPDWVHALREPETYAKTMYADVRGDYMVLTYAVKWRYPDRRRRFSAALCRALKECRRSGIKARVVRA